jgi:hypothetical protein
VEVDLNIYDGIIIPEELIFAGDRFIAWCSVCEKKPPCSIVVDRSKSVALMNLTRK